VNYIYQARFIGILDGFTKEQVETVLLQKYDSSRVESILNGNNPIIVQNKNRETIEKLTISLKKKGLNIKLVEIEEKRKVTAKDKLLDEVNKESIFQTIKCISSDFT
jgi:hypothetical protein